MYHDKIVNRIRPLAAGNLTHDLNSSPHRAWESRRGCADAMHHRVLLCCRFEETIDTPHWRHSNVTTSCSCSELFSQLTQYHRAPSCELLAALRLGAAGRPDVYVRPDAASASF